MAYACHPCAGRLVRGDAAIERPTDAPVRCSLARRRPDARASGERVQDERDALAEAGGDPARLDPAVPVATSTGHSPAVDVSAAPGRDMAREMRRNAERHRFMKWAANAARGFRVFSPGTGIMRVINVERLATHRRGHGAARRGGVVRAVFGVH